MKTPQSPSVADTMNAVERARALEGLEQAMLLADLVATGVARLRRVFRRLIARQG
jgi:hypothetical protein